MHRRPRNRQKDRLVDVKFFLDAFLYKGMFLSLAGFIMYFYYMSKYGGFSASDLLFAFDKWTDGYKGYTQDQLNEFVYTGQCVYFITIVITQFGNLFSTRTRHLSLFQHNPFFGPKKNLHLVRAVCISTVLAVLVVYLPFIQSTLNTRPPPIEFWMAPFGFAALLFCCDETKKYFVRKYPESLWARMSW